MERNTSRIRYECDGCDRDSCDGCIVQVLSRIHKGE